MTRPPIRAAVAVALAACTAAACASPPESPLEVGIKQVALSLAFSEADLVEPVEPEVIIRVIPAPPEVRTPTDLSPFEVPEQASPQPPAVPPPDPACPPAGPAASAEVPVSLTVAQPPAPGRYPRHNVGQFTILGGAAPLVLPYPRATTWDHSGAEVVEEPAVLGDPTTTTQFDIIKTISPTYTVIDRLQLDADSIALVRRTTVTEAGESVFEPTPALDIYRYGAEGTAWTVAGVDTESGTAMSIDAVIDDREVVDVCGTLVDTYRVTSDEQVVNLRTGETSGTDPDDPNVYNFATQYGGLIVREDVHQTATVATPEGTLVIEFDYQSTVDTIEPEAGG